MGIRQAQLATKLFGTLFHASDANANAIRLLFGDFLADAFAIIAHCYHDRPFPLRQRNPHLACFRMAENIGQSLLYDAKDSGFHFGCEPGKLRGLDVKRRFNATAFGESFHIPG
jgi:hypothetical protein